jgi:hypothetical protein
MNKHPLQMAIESLIEGINILENAGWDDFFSTAFYSTDPKPMAFGFDDANLRFERIGAYTSMLLLSDKGFLPINGNVFINHLMWAISIIDLPAKFCKIIYEAKGSIDSDWERAYTLNSSFVNAVGNLNSCLDKLRNNEIKVEWINGTEPDHIPTIPIPETINRKYK